MLKIYEIGFFNVRIILFQEVLNAVLCIVFYLFKEKIFYYSLQAKLLFYFK